MLPRNRPNASKSPSTTTAWWPMPDFSFRPPWPGVSVCHNWLTGIWIWAAPLAGPTPETS